MACLRFCFRTHVLILSGEKEYDRFKFPWVDLVTQYNFRHIVGVENSDFPPNLLNHKFLLDVTYFLEAHRSRNFSALKQHV